MRTPLRTALALGLTLALGGASPAPAADAPVGAFAAAWAAVDNYTATITVHETDGTAVQDRVYHYAYKRPSFAKIDVVAGPGKGSGAVWTGGDQVRGHVGGLFSGIKKSVPITDPRATSLRGDTIAAGSFQSVADDLRTGRVEPATAAVDIAGTLTDAVTLVPAPGAGGVTREVVYLSRATHLPVRRVRYAGDTLVKQEDFSDVTLDPGLTAADFN